MKCKHDYSNEWFCPYVDTEQERFIPTCCKCGKIKHSRNEYYVGSEVSK